MEADLHLKTLRALEEKFALIFFYYYYFYDYFISFWNHASILKYPSSKSLQI